MQMLIAELVFPLRLKGPLTRQHLVQDTTNSVNISTRVETVPLPLFRSHVQRRTTDVRSATYRTRFVRPVWNLKISLLKDLCKTEVSDLGNRPLCDKHVVGLQVTMHDPRHFPRCVAQPATDVDRKP